MKNIETKMNKISTKTAETHYLPYIYIYIYTFVVLKRQKFYAMFMSFYKNILRREILKKKLSSICDAKNGRR